MFELIVAREVVIPAHSLCVKAGLGDLAIGMTDNYCSSIYPTPIQLKEIQNNELPILEIIELDC